MSAPVPSPIHVPGPDPMPRPIPAAAPWVSLGLLFAGVSLAISDAVRALAFVHGPSEAASLDLCGCLRVSEVGAPGDVPLALYWVPAYLILVWHTFIARGEGERAAAARRGVGLLVSLIAGGSLASLGWSVLMLGGVCAERLPQDAINVGLLSLFPLGLARRPGLPAALERIAALLIFITVTGVTFQLALIAGARQQRATDKTLAEAAESVAETALRFRWVELPPVTLPAPSADVPVDRFDPSDGPLEATVRVVLFADATSPVSRGMEERLTELRERYSDRVRFIYKQLPEDPTCNSVYKGPARTEACPAARAQVCAARQNLALAYRERLVRHVGRFGPVGLTTIAAESGLDIPRFKGCVTDESVMKEILEDESHAGFLERSGQPRGPAVYIRGRRFGVDTTLPELDAAIRAELGDIAPLPDGRWPARQRVADEPALPLGLTDMVPVRSDPTRIFWIDPIPRSRKPVGRLQALAGQPPGLVTADEAALTCKLGGARLCLQPEWVTACQGAAAEDDDRNGDLADDRIEGRPYPYGNRRREGACPGGLGTGQAGGCRTPEGVYDLVGGPAEWTLGVGGAPVRMGGGLATCQDRSPTEGPEATGAVRCCADKKDKP